MKQPFVVAALVCLISATIAGTACAQTKSGAIKFSAGGKESVNVALGQKLKLDATYRVINVGNIVAISVSGTLKNTTSEKVHYAYFVSFMDKDKNLICCQSFNLWSDPGKQGMTGTFIQLPPDQVARIAYYSVAFYESDKAIGMK